MKTISFPIKFYDIKMPCIKISNISSQIFGKVQKQNDTNIKQCNRAGSKQQVAGVMYSAIYIPHSPTA